MRFNLNCEDCFVETGKLYCESCQTGFHFDENYRYFNKDESGKCVSEASIGCLEYKYEGSNSIIWNMRMR